jgi:hypothetical protein
MRERSTDLTEKVGVRLCGNVNVTMRPRLMLKVEVEAAQSRTVPSAHSAG